MENFDLNNIQEMVLREFNAQWTRSSRYMAEIARENELASPDENQLARTKQAKEFSVSSFKAPSSMIQIYYLLSYVR